MGGGAVRRIREHAPAAHPAGQDVGRKPEPGAVERAPDERVGREEDQQDEREARRFLLVEREQAGRSGDEHQRAVSGVAEDHAEEDREEEKEEHVHVALAVAWRDADEIEQRVEHAQEARLFDVGRDVLVVLRGIVDLERPAVLDGGGFQFFDAGDRDVALEICDRAGLLHAVAGGGELQLAAERLEPGFQARQKRFRRDDGGVCVPDRRLAVREGLLRFGERFLREDDRVERAFLVERGLGDERVVDHVLVHADYGDGGVLREFIRLPALVEDVARGGAERDVDAFRFELRDGGTVEFAPRGEDIQVALEAFELLERGGLAGDQPGRVGDEPVVGDFGRGGRILHRRGAADHADHAFAFGELRGKGGDVLRGGRRGAAELHELKPGERVDRGGTVLLQAEERNEFHGDDHAAGS